jgi:hypothetical protein
MEYRILGPMEVRDGDEAIALPAQAAGAARAPAPGAGADDRTRAAAHVVALPGADHVPWEGDQEPVEVFVVG